MTEGKTGLRLKVLAVLVVGMFLALTTRLWFLQVLAYEQARDAAEGNSVRLVEQPAPRGRILDASGEELVTNRQSLVLTINGQDVGDDKERVLLRLSEILEVPAAELGGRLDEGASRYYSYTPIPVAVDVSWKIAAYVKEHPREFPGVDLVELPVRTYPLGNAAAHVLGYLGEIDQDKLEDPIFAGYEPGDMIGITGVEAVYEHELAGTPGLEKYLVNRFNERLRKIGSRPPESGHDVYLTLDADTQRLSEESLILGMRHARTLFDEATRRNLTANAGAVVVMNPDTGGIEAMVSYPSFQPSLFTRRMSQAEYDRRFGEGKGEPLLNRAIAGLYPPGSTYKPWIGLSALERKREGGDATIVTTNNTYPCPGSWTVPFDESNPDAIQYQFSNWTSANLGFMSVAGALVDSCDTIFYPMGYEYWKLFYPPPWDDGIAGNDDLPAREPLQRDLRRAGFGVPTNVDLPGEFVGRVPDAEWKRTIHREFPNAFPFGQWVPGDFINMSIGQGDTLVTPLQLAAAFSALMHHEGRMCTPHVLDKVVDPDGGLVRGYGSRCGQRLPFDIQHVRYVREALTGTVRSGTAAGAFGGFPFSRVWVAGKTGTAEVEPSPPKQDYSWFAAMTEALGERHVIVVLVEQGGHGSTTAAPIARHIIEGVYGLEYSWTGVEEITDVAGTD
jgi:penicillin-binding protein 2